MPSIQVAKVANWDVGKDSVKRVAQKLLIHETRQQPQLLLTDSSNEDLDGGGRGLRRWRGSSRTHGDACKSQWQVSHSSAPITTQLTAVN